jgi:predicted GIY-YIG superfamily endonuclease
MAYDINHSVEQIEELLKVYPPDVDWLYNIFDTQGQIMPLDLWMLAKTAWKDKTVGLYALYAEKPIRKSWASEKQFIYVGISTNIAKRWEQHQAWVRDLVFSKEHLRSFGDRSSFWFCYYECLYEKAREIEVECWNRKHQLGLSFARELYHDRRHKPQRP